MGYSCIAAVQSQGVVSTDTKQAEEVYAHEKAESALIKGG